MHLHLEPLGDFEGEPAAGHPVSPRMAATEAAKPGDLSWIGETFTLTTGTCSLARSSWHTTPITQRPRSRMAPVRSAIGTKRLGGTDVPSSIFSRIRASTASTRPVATSRMG